MLGTIEQQPEAALDGGGGKTSYVAWLESQGTPLFRIRDQYWQRYKEALVPATTAPYFVNLTEADARTLLRESAAWFLRYCNDPSKDETEWWYVICDGYDPERLSSKTRNQIKRGARECKVKRIDADWLAEQGYRCYSAAFARYNNATPVAEPEYRRRILTTRSGPVELWGVFTGDALVGYCQCIIEGEYVSTSIVKLDPAYLSRYSSYALITGLIKHYVVEREMVITNGNRSIAHETGFQDLLLKLGFRKEFCRLNVVYHPWLNPLVKVAFPVLRVMDRLPVFRRQNKLQALLLQEELSNRCRPWTTTRQSTTL